MADGLNDDPNLPERVLRQAQPLNIQAMLPVLRAQTSQAEVEFLSYACAFNTMEAARWAALRWCLDADVLDPVHSYRSAASDPCSPVTAAADALTSLVAACHRFESVTGGNGIALAHATILRQFGQTLADYILDRLLECSIEFLIDNLDGAPIEASPDPTATDRTGAARVLLDHVCGDGPLGGLRSPLDALIVAARVDGDSSSPATQGTVERLGTAIQDAAREGVSMDDLQLVLNIWTDATGGPRVTLNLLEPENGEEKEHSA